MQGFSTALEIMSAAPQAYAGAVSCFHMFSSHCRNHPLYDSHHHDMMKYMSSNFAATPNVRARKDPGDYKVATLLQLLIHHVFHYHTINF